jgi:mRNA-degrading endonuclease RelE of RelBE toxin-antitoxin system
MALYRVFLAKEIVAQLRDCKRNQQQMITRFMEEIGDDPYREGDFAEQDDVGRDIQVKVIGRYALYFWSDHAAKEVKLIDMKVAGN